MIVLKQDTGPTILNLEERTRILLWVIWTNGECLNPDSDNIEENFEFA